MSNYQLIDNTSTEAPMVSVAMLTYNHQNYIGEAIESVLMQKTTFKVQLVIAEDYSPDSTRQIVIDYQKKYPDKIKLILQNENVGASKNNISLFENLNGKYIAALEGDDYWTDPLKLQKQFDFLEENEDYGVVCTNYLSNEIQISKSSSVEITLKEILKNSAIGTLTILFKKELLKDYLFESSNLSMGDYPLWIAFSKKTKIYKLADYTAYYRILEDSASGRNNFLKIKNFSLDILEITKQNLHLIRNKKDYDEIVRERYGQLFKILIDSKDKTFLKHQLDYFKVLNKIHMLDYKILIVGISKIYF